MKVCLYLEFYHFLNGSLFKNIGTGLLSSYKNQRSTLKYLDVDFVETWSDDCDILQINTPWLMSLWLIRRAKRLNKKVIIWSHVTAEDLVGVFRFSKFLAPVLKKYLTYTYDQADLVLCPTEYTKGLLMAYGLNTGKLVAHSNGVDLGEFFVDLGRRAMIRERYQLTSLTIGVVGLAIPRKGINTFIAAAEALPENNFIWFGKIYSKLLVESLPQSLPGNCFFVGYVDDILAAYNGLDIFLFPSLEENEGMVILEAAALGLPIIVRDIPVYDGWLMHGDNCLKAKTDKEFVDCLTLLINDKQFRQQLGERALELARVKSKELLAKKMLNLYVS